MQKTLFATLSLFVIIAITINADSNADLVNAKVERTVDLTSHLVHLTTLITVENKASSGSLKSYTYTVEPAHAKNVAFVGAHLVEGKNSKTRLNVAELSKSERGGLYRIDFKSELSAGKTVQLEVEVVLYDLLRPYPDEINQQDKQYVLYKGNHYYYSLYQTKTQTTVVNLASEKTESYSQLKPTSKSDSAITYGPYENVKPFEQNEMNVHYENNSPFLSVSNLLRTIEVSHWGNIAVEETIDMYHSGAKLRGSFSRFDYMRRQGGQSSVKSFRTLLPPSAAHVYYRDEIGNISTSNLRVPSKSNKGEPLELELRPRFPLFGGWKTHYTVGYNVPAYQYLHSSGSNFALKMKLIDHVYDDQLVESATIRVILPEHAKNIEFIAPYNVDRRPNELHYTYLDTVGRPVVVVNKKYAVDNHVQDFQIRYTYQRAMIVQKPLLVIAFFFVLFLVVILISRVDFTLHQTPEHQKKD